MEDKSMRRIAAITLAFLLCGASTENYLPVMQGTDCSLDSGEFTVHAHWKITCRVAKSGPQPDVTVYADPAAGAANLTVLHMTGDGEQSAYIADGGRYHLSVAGWDASWNVFVEDGK
jgi:hypothetical protein